MYFEVWQWAMLAFGAFIAGLSKGGIAGLAVLNVAIFALLLPARQSVGLVLALYLCTDIAAVTAYRRHASWPHLWRLFPAAGAGVIAGYFALGRLDDALLQKLIGAILLIFGLWELARRFRLWRAGDRENGAATTPKIAVLPAVLTGFAGGFTTMIANAAGPLMVLYLLATGLPKVRLVGTAAWFFLVLNLFKAPLSVHLGLLNGETWRLIAPLVPFSIAGVLLGRVALRFIPQKTFELVALVLALLAGLRLIWR